MPDTRLGGIAISEILADPNGANDFDTDGNGVARSADEFIEIVNTSSEAINISGLELWDAGRDNWFTFPTGTILEPGAFAVVVRNVQNRGSLPNVTGDNLAFDADFGNGVLSNNGDNFVIYDPDDDEFIQALFNGDTPDDPTATPSNSYQGFSATATRLGDIENFGDDQDGFSIQRTPTGFANDETPTPGAANVCFASGTWIATPAGFRRIEDLKTGDRICTRTSGPQPIRWVFSREISHAELLMHPTLYPVCLPGEQQLVVSRQHRILVSGKIANRMFGAEEVLVPAKDLVGYRGCFIDTRIRSLRYYHILLDAHHVINAGGFAAESLFLGRDGLHAMEPEARAELERIFPNIADETAFAPPPLCRAAVSGPRARRMAWRHERNGHDFVTQF